MFGNNSSKVHIEDMRLDFNKPMQDAKIVTTYIVENDSEIVQYKFTSPLMLASLPNVTYEHFMSDVPKTVSQMKVDLGFGPLEYSTMDVKVLERKTKKMTIKEIEKALGHKVEIVGEE